ncbi:DUF2334 domain-containing protein [Candidatus Pacearchaeota archaeon]|nr:DUF2334 domain-containing protein [Candidatus Pacearchaeota archaeon]
MLDVHLERCDDKGERLRKMLEIGESFIISIPPVLLLPEHETFRNGVYPNDYYYPKEIVEVLEECAKNKNIVFGQQGYTHYCPECFKSKEKRDPWHENRCLYGDKKQVEEQLKIISTGRKIIEDKLKVTPYMYVPPNHQFDGNTLIAAKKAGYNYFAERAIINFAPYSDGDLIILPEGDIGSKTEVVYTHYDQMKGREGEYFEEIRFSEPLHSLDIKIKPVLAELNRGLVTARKIFRDAVKNF